MKLNYKVIAVVLIGLVTLLLIVMAYQAKTRENNKNSIDIESFAVWKMENNKMVLFISSTSLPERKGYAELFDIENGKVIKRFHPEIELTKEVKCCIQNITDVVVKAKAFPTTGYILRVPLDDILLDDDKKIEGPVNEVFIFFPHEEKAYLMFLDKEKRPWFFNFDYDVKKIRKLVGLTTC